MNQPIRVLIIICLSIHISFSAHADQTLRPIALKGDPAPGFANPFNFNYFGFTTELDNRGQLLFDAYAINPGVENKKGTWLYDPTTGLQLIAAENTPAPSFANGYLVSSIVETHFNDAGQVAILGYINTSFHVWLHTPENPPRLIARQGDPVPDPGSALIFRDIQNPTVNDAGQVTFNSNFIRPGESQPDDYGTVLVEPNGSSRVLGPRTGDPAPGAGLGDTFIFVGAVDAAATNPVGQRVIRGVLQGPGVNNSNENGYWLADDDGSVSLIARDGDPAPGMPAGVTFGPAAFIGDYGDVGLNAHGQVAFSSFVVGPGVTSANNYGLWSNRRGPMELLHRSGDSVPGFANTVFTGFGDPVLNDVGQLAFPATVNGGPGIGEWSGLWAENTNGELQLILSDEVPAPGVNVNVSLSTFVLNARGQLAIYGFINGTTGDQGIWATNLAGQLIHIAHTGGTLDVDPGPGVNLKTVDDLRMYSTTGNSDGRPSLFNDNGELAFYASFTDGTSGVFLSTAVAIPEPAALSLAVLSLLALAPRYSHSAPRQRP